MATLLILFLYGGAYVVGYRVFGKWVLVPLVAVYFGCTKSRGLPPTDLTTFDEEFLSGQAQGRFDDQIRERRLAE